MYITIKNKKIKFYWKWTLAEDITYKIQFGILIFLIPENTGFDLIELQEGIKQYEDKILKELKETSKMYLVKRSRHELFVILQKYVKKWEKRMDVKARRIRITEKPLKNEWARCYGRGYLSFSSDCLELPEHILEVLVVHELVHIRVWGHGKDFYDEFERYIPGARVKDSEIDMYTDLLEEFKFYVDEEVHL